MALSHHRHNRTRTNADVLLACRGGGTGGQRCPPNAAGADAGHTRRSLHVRHPRSQRVSRTCHAFDGVSPAAALRCFRILGPFLPFAPAGLRMRPVIDRAAATPVHRSIAAAAARALPVLIKHVASPASLTRTTAVLGITTIVRASSPFLVAAWSRFCWHVQPRSEEEGGGSKHSPAATAAPRHAL